MNKNEKEGKVNLYECGRLFVETMNNKFPDVCKDSSMFLMTTDGKKVSSLINGDDGMIRDLLAYFIVRDDDIRELVRDAYIAAIQHLNQHKDETTV